MVIHHKIRTVISGRGAVEVLPRDRTAGKFDQQSKAGRQVDPIPWTNQQTEGAGAVRILLRLLEGQAAGIAMLGKFAGSSAMVC